MMQEELYSDFITKVGISPSKINWSLLYAVNVGRGLAPAGQLQQLSIRIYAKPKILA